MIVLDEIFQRIKNPWRENVHAEMRKIIPRRQPGGRQLFARLFDGRLFDNQLSFENPLGRFDRLAA